MKVAEHLQHDPRAGAEILWEQQHGRKKEKQCCVKKTKTSFGLRELKCSWENEEENEKMNGCLGRWVGWIRAQMFHSTKRTALTPPLVSQHHSEWLWQHLASMLLVTWLRFLPRTLRLKQLNLVNIPISNTCLPEVCTLYNFTHSGLIFLCFI